MNLRPNLPPFRSLRTEFDELISQSLYSDDDSLGIDRVVEDPVFETLLNQDGMVQIADTIYQVTRDYVYGTHIDNVSIPMKSDSKNGYKVLGGSQSTLSSTTFLVKYKIDRDVRLPVNPSKKIDAMGRGECYASFAHGRSGDKYRYRIKGSIWIINWFIHRSIGAELESQKIRNWRFLRRWRLHRVGELEMEGTFSYRRENESFVYEVKSWTKYNAEEIRKTLERARNDEFVDLGLDLTHRVYHTFEDGRTFAAFCTGYRTWAASD